MRPCCPCTQMMVISGPFAGQRSRFLKCSCAIDERSRVSRRCCTTRKSCLSSLITAPERLLDEHCRRRPRLNAGVPRRPGRDSFVAPKQVVGRHHGPQKLPLFRGTLIVAVGFGRCRHTSQRIVQVSIFAASNNLGPMPIARLPPEGSAPCAGEL
jgi:hypothetical protein